MEPTDFSPEELIDLVERLRLSGFKIGAGQHITAQNLLALITARGLVDVAPNQLGAWLAPILCTSPEEQTAFHKLFEEWLEERRRTESSRTELGHTLLRNRWLWVSAAIIATAAVVFVVRSARTPIIFNQTSATPTLTAPPPEVSAAPAWTFATVMGLLALIAGAWWLWKVPRISHLVRWRDEVELPLEHLRVRGVAEHLFSGGLHALRRYRLSSTVELDINSTVDATVRNAGCFTPIYSFKKATPEYLLMIDRTGYGDQYAALGEALYRRLREAGVIVERYYFQSEPENFREGDLTGAHLTLEEVIALHPSRDFIIFSDGEGLLDPMTGRPGRWLSRYTRRSLPVLLTPMPQRFWGPRERLLEREGLLLVYADSSGVLRLAEKLLDGVSTKHEAVGWHPRYPEVLRQRPERWLIEELPPPEALKILRFQLRLFLGAAGYQWLCACAVYPVLLWDLTLYLGRALPQAVNFEESLSKIVQLPWFRHGIMPYWLRVELVSDLEPEQEREVRQALNDLLVSCAEGTLDSLELEILLRRRTQQPPLLQGGQILSDYLKTHPESRLRDYVLLTFMLGLKPDRLAVEVPAEVFDRLQSATTSKWPIYLIDVALLGLAYYILIITTLFPSPVGLTLGLAVVLCSVTLVFQLHEWSLGDITSALRSMNPHFWRVKDERPAGRHPKGLYVLLAVTMWERFGYYSMRAVLLTYLREGQAWPTANWSTLFGWFSICTYVALLPGGWLGDGRFGRRRTITVGGLLLLAGYLLLTQNSSFALYAALLCIATGGGLFKSNTIVLVGDFYSEGSGVKDRAYTLLYLSIYIGALAGQLAMAYVSRGNTSQLVFIVSAGGLLMSLLILLIFKRHIGAKGSEQRLGKSLQADDMRSAQTYEPQNFEQETIGFRSMLYSRRIFALTVSFFLAVIYWACVETGSTPTAAFAQKIVPEGMQSIFLRVSNGVMIIILILPMVGLWREFARRGKEPSTPVKMAVGLALSACSFYVMALAGMIAGDGGQVSIAWLVCVYLLAALGEIMVAPMVLSFVSNAASRRRRGLIIGIFLCAAPVGSWLSSFVLALYGYADSDVHSNIFVLLGTTGLLSAAILFSLVRRIKRAMTDDKIGAKPSPEMSIVSR